MLIEPLLQLIKYFLIFLVLWTFLSYFWRNRKTFSVVHSRWHHTFEKMQLTPKEFYAAVAEEVQKKKVSGTVINTRIFSEEGLFSSDRLYLEIKRGDQLFLVCAARFGTEHFVSWWFGEPVKFMDDFILRIPYIGKRLSEAMNSMTFFQMDTDDMFKDMVKNSVLAVVDAISNDKGIRPLSELERQPIDTPLKRM